MDGIDAQQHPRRKFIAAGGVAVGALATSMLTPASARAADPVTSVNTMTGDVVLTADDVGALPRTVAGLAFVVADPTTFTGLDPSGSADSTAPLQAALNTVPEGGSLIIPAGTYRVDGNLSVPSGRSVSVVGYGATLVHSAVGPMISVVGAYDSRVAISSINAASQTFPSGASASVTVLSTSAAPPWSSGDILKLVSDDEIVEARPGSGGNASRRGEFVTVDRVNGNQTHLAGLVRDSYSANIRAARISPQTFRLEGLTLDVTPNGLANSYGVTVHLMGLLAPVVRNIRILGASSIGLQFTSCFGYRVENATISRVAENISDSQLGYAILDNCSAFGTIIGGTFRYVRHAYTDDTPRVAAGSDILRFGRTFGTKVIGASAMMTTNNSWDTHHCSEGVEFISCSASGGIPRRDQGYAGFGLRGKAHRVIGCTANDMESGVTVFTEGGGGESHSHMVSDLVARRAASAAIVLNINGDSHPSARERSTGTTINVQSITAVDCRRLLYAVNAIAHIRDATYIAPVGVDGVEYNGITNRNSLLDLRDVVLDYSKNTSGKPQAVLAVSSGAGWTPGAQDSILNGLTVRATESVTQRVTRPLIGGSHRIRGRRIEFTYPFAVLPGDRDSSSIIEWRCASDPGAAEQDLNSAYFYLAASELASPMTKVRQSPDSNIIVKVNPSSSSATATEFLPGYFRGQVVRFWVQDTVSGSWQVPHSTDAGIVLAGLQSRILRRRDQLTVIWDGAVWREAA